VTDAFILMSNRNMNINMLLKYGSQRCVTTRVKTMCHKYVSKIYVTGRLSELQMYKTTMH